MHPTSVALRVIPLNNRLREVEDALAFGGYESKIVIELLENEKSRLFNQVTELERRSYEGDRNGPNGFEWAQKRREKVCVRCGRHIYLIGACIHDWMGDNCEDCIEKVEREFERNSW